MIDMLIYACVSCTFECVCDLQKQKMFPTFCSGLKKAKRQPVHEHRRVAGRLPASETLPESIHCHRRAPAFFYVYIISNKLPEESKKKNDNKLILLTGIVCVDKARYSVCFGALGGFHCCPKIYSVGDKFLHRN